jgi:protein involved in polysaccharide export with SLBB domain
MPRILQRKPRRRGAWIALFLLPGAALAAILPGTARALGGPQPVTVSVEGEVRRPGAYTLPPGATLSTLILAAGGFSDNADMRGASLARVSARQGQQAELREMAGRLAPEPGAAEAAREAARPVVALLEDLRPSGRVPIRLTHPRLLKNSPRDLPLEEGDVLRIPSKADSVTVAGAVRGAPGAVPFTPKTPLKEYIRRAGGYADDADRNQVFLLRADGTTADLSPGFVSWNPVASRWEVTALAGGPPEIGPGDTIVVPRTPPPGLPSDSARKLPEILRRAAEIAGAPVVLP